MFFSPQIVDWFCLSVTRIRIACSFIQLKLDGARSDLTHACH